ncbi:marine proteobacterial sortase target protein [bacterium]|nr:marine proteobacterial sortase target protein [bacterium]
MKQRGQISRNRAWQALFVAVMLTVSTLSAQVSAHENESESDLCGPVNDMDNEYGTNNALIEPDSCVTERSCQEELGPEVSLSDIGRGSLVFHDETRDSYILAPTLTTDVQMWITGLIVRAEVRQTFHNPSDEWLEGVYAFPLPESAAVDHLNMLIGNRVIEAELHERVEAQHMYNTARITGKKASLLSQERPNIFTMSVANIAPQEEIVVIINYQHHASFDGSQFQIRFPLVVAPRFSPGELVLEGRSGRGWAQNTEAAHDAARIAPPLRTWDAGPDNYVRISVELEAGFPIRKVISPYHDIDIFKIKPEFFRIELLDRVVPADCDFVLSWEPARDRLPQAAVFTQTDRDLPYALIMVMPPSNEDFAEVKLPRECIFVIDTSGSMHGNSIQQARQSLLFALERLQSDDQFNIIQCNSFAERLFEHSMPVTPETLEQAGSYIRSMRAKGGTHMLAALQQAFEDHGSLNRLRQVIFITDGAIDNEEQLFQYIEHNLKRSRLFTVGIGPAPNTHFMQNAARYGQGSFTQIGSSAEVATRMDLLFARIENPLLADIEIEWNDPDLEYYPSIVPDLYLGEPIVVCARLEQLRGQIAIRGNCNGFPWKVTLPLTPGQEHQSISTLWARKKIEELTDRILKSTSTERAALRREIIAVAFDHNLVTKYTSLIAVDKTPGKPLDASRPRAHVPINLPAGWDMAAAYGCLPQTATPSIILVMMGLICCATAGLIRLLLKGNPL